jgi:hypothetical protein
MARFLLRALERLVVVAFFAVILGSNCGPKPAEVTKESLQADVEVLGDVLCALHAERGSTPPAGPFGTFICPYPPEP